MTPAGQLKHIVVGAIDHVYRKPEVFRFYLHLQTQPESDEVVAKYSKRLVEESARQFEHQCDMFEKLGVKEPRMRSLYFSSVLQGTMFMLATYPEWFPVKEVKEQIIQEFLDISDD
jgi:hypothetical protein